MEEQSKKAPIINAHTHIFTGHQVPPYLAKTFLWFPFYYLLHLPTILRLFKLWNYLKSKIISSTFISYINRWRNWFDQNVLFSVLRRVFNLFITLQVFLFLYGWAKVIEPENNRLDRWVEQISTWLSDNNLLFLFENEYLNLLFTVFFLVFFKSGRNLILFVFEKIFSFLKMIPGKMTRDLIARYILLARYALHKNQRTILGKLKDQYPPGTKFIVLPMDMEFMEAGKLPKKNGYYQQMDDLLELKESKTFKDCFFPFVFIDPRRIERDKEFFKFSIVKNKEKPSENSVCLEDSFVKKFIETNDFNGFKIYPSLGYYPFDEKLLPLWKYAADNGIPILTHCIKGTIFYRGNKKKEWNYHPAFKEKTGKGVYEPLLLPQRSNKRFTLNFTHPLNFLCLLKEPLLRRVVAQAKDERIKELFGFIDAATPMRSNLNGLKICFGHFGGDDQWLKFFEADRYAYSQQIIKNPDFGIDFMKNKAGKFSEDKLQQLWHYTDWYSIICSMMLQHPNVYSDISYILHNQFVFPLLRRTLASENSKLRKRVLYGTDFYVVRNHKSEKHLSTNITFSLSEEEFDLIARENPVEFLKKGE